MRWRSGSATSPRSGSASSRVDSAQFMARQALFAGLVADERGDPVGVAHVGGESFYVVDDAGFMRHVESERVDRQGLGALAEFVRGHEELISAETMKALGQEDISPKAAIE